MGITKFTPSSRFRYKREFYSISATLQDGTAHVDVSPQNEELSAEVKRRIEAEGNFRVHSVGIGQASYDCFPEDAPNQ